MLCYPLVSSSKLSKLNTNETKHIFGSLFVMKATEKVDSTVQPR